MIFLNLKLCPSLERVQDVVSALRIYMGPTQVQPGCIHCRLSQALREPNVILYEEAWSCWEQLEKHICSDRFAGILHLMEVSCDAPQLTFNDVHETRGMEYVWKLRMHRVDKQFGELQ